MLNDDLITHLFN